MEGDSSVQQIKLACSNESRWFRVGWFGVMVMALVTSTKLSYVEPG